MVPGVEGWGGVLCYKRKLWDQLPKLLSPRLSVTDFISRGYNDLIVVLIYSAGGPIQVPVGAGP